MRLHRLAKRFSVYVKTLFARIDTIETPEMAQIALEDISNRIEGIEGAINKLENLSEKTNGYYRKEIAKLLKNTLEEALELQSRLEILSKRIAKTLKNVEKIENKDELIKTFGVITDTLAELKDRLRDQIARLRRLEETLTQVLTLRGLPKADRLRLRERLLEYATATEEWI